MEEMLLPRLEHWQGHPGDRIEELRLK
jgi:hypothetical protein